MNRDEKIYKERKNGNRVASDKLVEMYYAEIFRYCRWHTKSLEQAEDMTQETFLKFFRYINEYKDRGMLKAFLYKIAENTCKDLAKKKSSSEELFANHESLEPVYEETKFSDIESEQSFYEVISILPEKQREIVILRYSQDMTIKEIAKITGERLRTVQSSLRSALKKIKKEMGKE